MQGRYQFIVAHFTCKEIEHLTASIDETSLRGERDRALVWLGYEGDLRPW